MKINLAGLGTEYFQFSYQSYNDYYARLQQLLNTGYVKTQEIPPDLETNVKQTAVSYNFLINETDKNFIVTFTLPAIVPVFIEPVKPLEPVKPIITKETYTNFSTFYNRISYLVKNGFVGQDNVYSIPMSEMIEIYQKNPDVKFNADILINSNNKVFTVNAVMESPVISPVISPVLSKQPKELIPFIVASGILFIL